MKDSVKIQGYFTQAQRVADKEEARQRDLADLLAERVTLTALHQRNRALSKDTVKGCQVISWGFEHDDASH
jgi:hypothetical protein